jgi:branched-chain amino acid aminotransferase
MGAMHRYILHNDSICAADERVLATGQVGFLNGWGVFSTIRVARGVLFEYERHFARMKRDAKLMRVPFPGDADGLEQRLLRLVERNEANDATLRLAVVRNRGGLFEGPNLASDFDLVAFTTGLNNWGTGVNLGVVPQARHAASRFAGVKFTSWAINLTLYEEAHDRGFDEVVLLNERGEVSECTSANIFMAKDGDVWTPPLDSGCLAGVTRDVLLSEIRVPGIHVGEKALTLSDLEAADEVFITSTTRDLLPVLSIEGIRVRREGRIREFLQAAFTQHIGDYVCAHAGVRRA